MIRFAAFATLTIFAAIYSCYHKPDISRWHYQLQNYSQFIEKHRDAKGTLFVIDYSKDGTQENAFTEEELSRLKNRGRNKVFSYLSVGEAEEVRWYYKRLPAKAQTFGPAPLK